MIASKSGRERMKSFVFVLILQWWQGVSGSLAGTPEVECLEKCERAWLAGRLSLTSTSSSSIYSQPCLVYLIHPNGPETIMRFVLQENPIILWPSCSTTGDSSACAPESYRIKRPCTAIKFLSHFRKNLFFFSSTAFVSLFGCAFGCSGQQKF